MRPAIKPVTLLSLLAALTLAVPPAAAQSGAVLDDPRESSPFGICIHKALQEDGPAAEALDALGAPWVRIDINWNEVEPTPGVFDFAVMDRMVDTARAHGLLVFATLAYTPQWATSGPVRNGVPTAASHYGNFVRAVVERYADRVKHWGMWNEPEQSHFWAGSAQQYVDLVLVPGANAVHETDPEALVLGPDSGSDEWLDDIFAAGGGEYLDVITVHVYACCDDTDNVDKVLRRFDCTGALPWDSCRRSVIEDHGLDDKPVWLTEVGWKTHSATWESRQASFYVELLDAMRTRPWWEKTIFYELYDETTCDPAVDNCWGIVRPDWSRKPAFDALAGYIATYQPASDAGTPPSDGGAADSGALLVDAGTGAEDDAGTTPDAGAPSEPDAGPTAAPDAGPFANRPPADAEPRSGCTCAATTGRDALAIAVVLVLAVVGRSRRGRGAASGQVAGVSRDNG